MNLDEWLQNIDNCSDERLEDLSVGDNLRILTSSNYQELKNLVESFGFMSLEKELRDNSVSTFYYIPGTVLVDVVGEVRSHTKSEEYFSMLSFHTEQGECNPLNPMINPGRRIEDIHPDRAVALCVKELALCLRNKLSLFVEHPYAWDKSNNYEPMLQHTP